MEFDKSRIYTAVNAAELEIGDEVIVADNLADLSSLVTADDEPYTLCDIKPLNIGHRFVVHRNGIRIAYYFAYLVRKSKWRPYKDCEEMVADFTERYNKNANNTNADNPMWHPLIWVKHDELLCRKLITTFGDDEVFFVDTYHISLQALFDNYTYLDGSVCGMKEE